MYHFCKSQNAYAKSQGLKFCALLRPDPSLVWVLDLLNDAGKVELKMVWSLMNEVVGGDMFLEDLIFPSCRGQSPKSVAWSWSFCDCCQYPNKLLIAHPSQESWAHRIWMGYCSYQFMNLWINHLKVAQLILLLGMWSLRSVTTQTRGFATDAAQHAGIATATTAASAEIAARKGGEEGKGGFRAFTRKFQNFVKGETIKLSTPGTWDTSGRGRVCDWVLFEAMLWESRHKWMVVPLVKVLTLRGASHFVNLWIVLWTDVKFRGLTAHHPKSEISVLPLSLLNEQFVIIWYQKDHAYLAYFPWKLPLHAISFPSGFPQLEQWNKKPRLFFFVM